MPTKRQHCFVIMPISQTSEKHTKAYWAKHFNSFLKIHIEEGGKLKAHRSKALRGDILREIITDLVTVPIVVADLTDNNSNVYWELGVRQSFKHGTITIAEEGTKLPFDIGGKGTLFYDPKDHLKMEEFLKDFKTALKDCLSNPEIPDSHVLETLSGRGTLFEILNCEESIRRLEGVLAEYNENLETINKVLEVAKKNIKTTTKTTEFVTRMLRKSSIELLTTNRYIHKDQSFYNVAELYLIWIIAINNQISSWGLPKTSDRWFIEAEKDTMKAFENFINEINSARKELKSKF